MAQTKVHTILKSDVLDRVFNRKIGVDVVYIFPCAIDVQIPDRPDVWMLDFKQNSVRHNRIQTAKLASHVCKITRSTLFYVSEGDGFSDIVSGLLKLNYALPMSNFNRIDTYSSCFLKYKKQVEDSVGYANIVRNGRKMRFVVDAVVGNGIRLLFVTSGKRSEVMEIVSKHSYDLSLTFADSELVGILDFVPLSEIDAYVLRKIQNNTEQKYYEGRYRKRNSKIGV